MDRKIAKAAQRHFVTGVGLITSSGSVGQNVMAAEWTMQVSFEPLMIAVFIHPTATTLKNIKETKEFGVNISTDDQASLVNIAGGYSRKELHKLNVKDSFRFYKSRYIKPPMIAGCVVNVECKLVMTKKVGDHTMVVGKAVSIRYNKARKPLVYHTGRYFKLGSMLESFRKTVKVNEKTFEFFSKETAGKFILKCVGAQIRSHQGLLVSKYTRNKISYEIIPLTIPQKGKDYRKTILDHLKKLGLNVNLKKKPILKRLLLQNKKKVQRINFVLYEGNLNSSSSVNTKQWILKLDPLLKALS